MYDKPPSWLPAFVCVSPWRSVTYEVLYDIFRTDFLITKPAFEGHAVTIPPDQEDGKEKIFWHLTTKDCPEGRLPDLRRAERLPWIRPTVESTRSRPEEITVFSYEEKRSRKSSRSGRGSGGVRIYIWFPSQGYVIVLKKLGNGNHMLITAYYMEREHNQEKIQRKHSGRIK